MTAANDEALLASLDPAQLKTLEQFLQLLLEANAKFNLTAIRNPEEAWDRHIIECVRLLPLLDEVCPPHVEGRRRRLLDVGSGGGLPGMVLAILRPDLDVTLLESIEKKARFLRDSAQALGLTHVSVACERAEVAAAEGEAMRESYDVVSARAVAALRTLLEITVPFLKVGGTLLSVKGERAQEELDEAKGALQKLHTECIKSERQPTATVLFLRKNKPTHRSYPRRSGEPKRKPL